MAIRPHAPTFSYSTYTISILTVSVIPLLFFVMSHIIERSRPRNNNAVSLQTAIMDQAVTALTRGIRHAVVTLFDDESLANTTSESHIAALQQIRDVFQNWEGYTQLFQKCLAYVQEYKCTYDDSATRGASEIQAVWKDLQGMADDLLRLLDRLTTTLEEAKRNLESHMTLPKTGVISDKHNELVQVADETVKALKNLDVFFRDQVDHLLAASQTRQDLKGPVEAWKHSEYVLSQAIGSISATEDAAKVDLDWSASVSQENGEG